MAPDPLDALIKERKRGAFRCYTCGIDNETLEEAQECCAGLKQPRLWHPRPTPYLDHCSDNEKHKNRLPTGKPSEAWRRWKLKVDE